VSESEEAKHGPVTPFGRSGAQTTGKTGLRRLANVARVQAADFGELHDPACLEDLDRPEIGRVLVQREVGTRLIVVGGVAGQEAGAARRERARDSSTRAGSS
jgi:hypothetical protein